MLENFKENFKGSFWKKFEISKHILHGTFSKLLETLKQNFQIFIWILFFLIPYFIFFVKKSISFSNVFYKEWFKWIIIWVIWKCVT
jgi:hypothetical protein